MENVSALSILKRVAQHIQKVYDKPKGDGNDV
jgi:hypothetical protein